jgi:hypothetical protein
MGREGEKLGKDPDCTLVPGRFAQLVDEEK